MGRRVIIFHYHLNPGGVTRIIESQIDALKQQNQETSITVICGSAPGKQKLIDKGISLIENDLFNYLPDNLDDYKRVYQEIKAAFLPLIKKNDLLHIHNLNLGKNPLITLLLSELAQQGYALVNHAHDFAEDRSKNLHFLTSIIEGAFHLNLNDVLYPALSNYQFACLNSFDRDRLLSYKVPAERITMVPNPVIFSERAARYDRKEICTTLAISPDKKTITYPVRVIQRKNIGEFILLAYLLQDKANWVVTQPPQNPVEIEFYLKWKQFCKDAQIPVCFEAGTKVDFEGLIKMSDFCITTSIQEGFGMVYMEPWLLGTPVIGRNIDMVTRDLIDSGVQFPLLYNQIETDSGGDYGKMSQNEQMKLLIRIKNENNIKNLLFELNPFLLKILSSIDEALISENKNIILKEYSLEKFSQRINGIYKRITY